MPAGLWHIHELQGGTKAPAALGWRPLCCPEAGREGSSLNRAPRGFTWAWFGSGQASSPCKGVQCCRRAVSEAAGTWCQECALPTPSASWPEPCPPAQSLHLSAGPWHKPSPVLAAFSHSRQCLPPSPPPWPATGLCHHVPHSKQRLARSSCSTERWGYLPALPIPT